MCMYIWICTAVSACLLDLVARHYLYELYVCTYIYKYIHINAVKGHAGLCAHTHVSPEWSRGFSAIINTIFYCLYV